MFLQLAQPLRRLIERRIVLREAETQHREAGRPGVEDGNGDRCHTCTAQQRVRELNVGLLRDRAEIEQLKIGTARRRPAETRAADGLEKAIALALIELAERRAVRRELLQEIRDRELQRRGDTEGIELMHAP